MYCSSHTEHKTYYDAKVNEDLYITYPVAFTPWNMAFTPKGRKKSIMLMRAGNLVEEDDSMSESFTLRWRIYKMKTALFIDSVESTDSGAFEFRDQEGNLVLVVQVKVEDGERQHFFLMGGKLYEQTVTDHQHKPPTSLFSHRFSSCICLCSYSFWHYPCDRLLLLLLLEEAHL